jgi:excisionase family DNA binding protein
MELLAYTVKDACRVLGIGRSMLYKLIAESKLKPIKIGRRTLIPRAEIERLFKKENLDA